MTINRRLPDNITQPSKMKMEEQLVNTPKQKALYERIFAPYSNKNEMTVFNPLEESVKQIDKKFILKVLGNTFSNTVFHDSNSFDTDIEDPKDPTKRIPITISQADINDFIKNNLARNYHEVEKRPFFPPMFNENNQDILNKWSFVGINPDNTKTHLIKPFLDLIYYLICGGINHEDTVSKTFDDYNKIMNGTYENNTELQFYIVLQWLAERYQVPLKCANTVLLLFSTQQSIGKSSIGQLIGSLLDPDYVQPVNGINNLIGTYQDIYKHSGILDVSDLSQMAPHKIEELLRSRVRPPAGVIKINIKSKEMLDITPRYSFIISDNRQGFITLNKGRTSRYHLIEGMKNAAPNSQKYILKEQILSSMISIINTQSPNLKNQTTLDFLEGLSSFFNDVKIDENVTNNSTGYETDIMNDWLVDETQRLTDIIKSSYNELCNYRSSKTDYTKGINFDYIYEALIKNNKLYSESEISKATLKTMIMSAKETDLVGDGTDPNKGRYYIKIIPPEIDENSEYLTNNVVAMNLESKSKLHKIINGDKSNG